MKPNELFNYLKSIKHEEYITAEDDVQYLVRTFHDEKRIRLMFEESCGKTDWKNNFNFTILFAVIFLTGNIFTNKEKYYIDFTKELMFYKSKDKKKAR